MDVESIDQYLAAHNIDAIKDKSGIRFHLDEVGTNGLPPRLDQSVKATYTGKFLNGTVFDPGGTITQRLDSLILGWQIGLSVWPAGTKGTLYVPSPFGYGDATVQTVPPNSILVFTIDLHEVVLGKAEQAQFASDLKKVDDYLAEKSIDAIKDTTGVRYVITEPGSGPLPTWYTKVKFKYKGTVLSSGIPFFDGTAEPTDTFDCRVVDFLNGIKVGLSKIGVGGKITVYLASGLAFGERSTQDVPENSNVIYEIELLEIVP
jgi:FKBP-type peptidyl-prolyl cis-trans isomerase